MSAIDELREIGSEDPNFIKDLIQVFLQSMQTHPVTIGAAISARNDQGLAHAAHAFKSSSYSLGAKQVGDLCAALEAFGKKGGLAQNPAGAESLHQQLVHECSVVASELNALPEMKASS